MKVIMLISVLTAAAVVAGCQSVAPADVSGSPQQSSSARSVIPYATAAPDAVPFTLVVIPDSQFMVTAYQGGTGPQFVRQVGWIKSNQTALNIQFVSHVGDIADSANDPDEWTNVRLALDGLENTVPFGMAYGNHDFCHFDVNWNISYNKAWLEEGFRAAFPVTNFEGKPWFGGCYPAGKMDNNYEVFSSGGMDFLIIHLGYDPDAAARAWADGVLKAHPLHRAIISTHDYYNTSVSTIGLKIWNDVVKNNPQVFLVVCGHYNSREQMKTATNAAGFPVYQILTDYQADNPQKAMLRYYQFVPQENKIKAYTLSTETGVFENDANSRFDLTYPMH